MKENQLDTLGTLTEAQQAKIERLTQGMKENNVGVKEVNILMNCFGLPSGWASVVIRTASGDRVYGISPEGNAHS